VDNQVFSVMVEYREVRAKRVLNRYKKRVLNRYKYRDNWFWCRYSINPYRGCQFACNYCDAITERYLVHENYEDFSRIIYIKTNAPELLERELEREKKDVVSLSGVTDPYQPVERKYGITRRILEKLRDNHFPVHLLEMYEKLYGSSQSPSGRYRVDTNRKVFRLCKKYGIPIHATPPSLDRPLRRTSMSPICSCSMPTSRR